MIRSLGVIALMSCSATALPMESGPLLTLGSRVRAMAPGLGAEPLIGTVVGLEPGVVLVRRGPAGPPLRIPVAPTTRLEVSGGRKSQAGRGAMLGAAIGAMPGLFATFGDYNTYDPNPAAVAAIGAAAGAAVGAGIGWALKSEQWVPAEVPAVTAGVAPRRGGVAFSLRVAWGGR
jgi:hypothetical protein